MSNNENNLKSKNIRRNVLIISIIVFLSIIAVFVGYSKFTSTKNSEISVSLAGWNFKIDGKEHNSGNIQFEMSRTDTNNSVAAGKIAPGTSGELPIFVDVAGTDTALEYTINFLITNKPTNLKFYIDKEKTQEIAVRKISDTQGEFTKKGYMTLEQVQAYNNVENPRQREETIYWDWPYEYDFLVNLENNLSVDVLNIVLSNLKNKIKEYNLMDSNDVGKEVIIAISGKGMQAIKEPEISIKIAKDEDKDGIKETYWIVPLTRDNAANYYGSEVKYKDNQSDIDNVYRLFYVDFDGKYDNEEKNN